jgi:hypothetical protein
MSSFYFSKHGHNSKIVWTKDNVKTLGIQHGYNIQNDEIWKSIIDKLKNCVHIWKCRKVKVITKLPNSEQYYVIMHNY